MPVDDVEATFHLDYADVNTFLADQPFDLTIVKASTDAEGLSLTATARDLVLPATETPTRHCPPVENGRA